MVLRNVAKTFSLEEQREEINEIAVDLDAVNTTLTNWNAANWDTAYSWGDHSLSGYATQTFVNTALTNLNNWDTAYGWGDHGTAGYLVATSASYNNTDWDTAYGWGDHAQGGYLTAYQTDAQIKSSYEANADTNAFTDALQTKLNGIETSATADQTGAEIKTAYEGEADTNAFTDALQTKLNGIADGAEVNQSPGGTYSGAGTALDPAIGSIQFKNTGNTFGGDSLFTYDNTNNKLSVGISSGNSALNVVRTGTTSVDTAYFYASTNGADNRFSINTVANQGGNPFIRFDSGGSNMVIGQRWVGTTSNKLVLGTGETPDAVQGLSIDGNGNGIYGNGHQSSSLAVDADSNRGLNFSTGGRIYCKTDDHWDFNLVGGGLMMRFRNGNDNGSGATQTPVGNITIQANSVDFNTTQSDSRLKKNIESWSEEVLQHFKTLQPKKFHFNWQSDEESLETGYIAQDLVDTFPEAYPLCKTEVDGEEVDRYSFNPSGMVKYLMKALQEEIAKREALEARLDAAGL